MTTTELIARLQALLAKHGDLPVACLSDSSDYGLVRVVDVDATWVGMDKIKAVVIEAQE